MKKVKNILITLIIFGILTFFMFIFFHVIQMLFVTFALLIIYLFVKLFNSK